MNNILQNIKSSAELSLMYLVDPVKVDKLKELVLLISQQVSRGSRLISNIQNITELEKIHDSIYSLNVCKVIKDSVYFIESAFQESNINICVDLPKDDVFIQANGLLQNAFENILINGINYNENQIIEIVVRLSRIHEAGNKFVRIEFIDNGRGISDLQKRLIFKEEIEKEKSGKGMGFGLTLVSKLVRIYFGKIWVEDKIKGDYEKGSNFVIVFPEII